MKHILITGGSRGIGAAMVRAFAKEGYKVTFTYLKNHELAQELCQETGAISICADSSVPSSVKAAVRQAEEQQGGVDILICNAAISSFRMVCDITEEEWRQMMAVNLDAPFYFTQAVLPHMVHNKWGRIIHISSIWGQTGASCEVHYSTAKAGVIGMTQAMAKEFGPSGITVNCIAPGVIDTDMNAMLSQEVREELAEETPVGRLGSPEEVAATALFLASDSAAFITGQVIGQNGGLYI